MADTTSDTTSTTGSEPPDAVEAPQGASVWEAAMIRYLNDHMRTEGKMLQQYVDDATATESKALAYLVNLLADDERRHHRWFNDLAGAVRSVAELDPSTSPIPLPDFGLHDRAETAELIDTLLENEQSDRAELKRLRKQLKDMEDTTMWGLLVKMMQLDTDKHIAMLKYARKHL